MHPAQIGMYHIRRCRESLHSSYRTPLLLLFELLLVIVNLLQCLIYYTYIHIYVHTHMLPTTD